MDNGKTNWKRMQFKGNKVWLSTDPDGRPVVKNGRVLIKYRLDQDYEYWVHAKGVQAIDPSKLKKKAANKKQSANKSFEYSVSEAQGQAGANDSPAKDNAVCIYTDGASSGNPGPSGIGVLLRFGKHQKEVSKYIGIATNNMAELEAIRTGLQQLKKTDVPVRVFTDSAYAYGLLALGWRPRKNEEMVRSIKKIISKFSDLRFIKVEGHAGHEGNERADFLATSAIAKRRK